MSGLIELYRSNPRILFFDIETSPNLGWIWGKWEQDVIDFKSHWYVLAFTAKWYKGETTTKGLIDYPNYDKSKENDLALIKDIWKLFDQADIVVAHNGDSFDIKKCNARFSFYGMQPPSPYQTIDTLKVAKKYFAFTSNKLDDLGKFLGIGAKYQTGGFKLWQDCMSGKREAWNKMKRYNKQDVNLLEKIYLHFLPWIKNHPNYNIFTGQQACPRCGSNKLHSNGVYRTLSGTRHRMRCYHCGGSCVVAERLEKPIKVTKAI
jgi:uncharacterized protein YprB with RNaseH-like and TPR domain